MAGRILPVALAAISGVAIGMATFEPELKEQRKKRLEEDYKRDLIAAAASSKSEPSQIQSDTVKGSSSESTSQSSSKSVSSGLESVLGLWAWKKGGSPEATPSQAPPSNDTPTNQKR